ncbi:MAG: hypothetical protein V1814_00090 [Candidatus Moraniibacteriota bacterium]
MIRKTVPAETAIRIILYKRKQMRKNNIFLEMKYFLIISAVFLFAFGAAVNARAKTMTDGNFKITCDDPLFTVTNAAPGESFSSDMTVENLGGKDRKFQFEFNIKTNPKALAKKLFLKAGFLDEADKFICEYGCDGDKDLDMLDGGEFVVKTIPGDDSKNLRFILTLDPNAGNEFQSADMSFDIKLGFKGEADGDGNGDGDGVTFVTTTMAGFFAGAPGTGIAGTIAESEGAIEVGEVKGDQTPKEGEVEGAEISLCQGWPKWVWVLMLIAYFAAFLWRTFEKIKEQIEKREIRWKWQAALAAAAFLIWYFFDFCREYLWFVVIAIIGGAIIYLYYLYLFRKNIREEHAEIKSGSGEDAPKDPTGQTPPTV